MPEITIIVPVYNVEKYLKRCLDSILHQTFIDFEIILVDDGSLDNSLEICYDYEKKDKRIKVIHKENGGLTSARIAGYNVSKGNFICFLDSDDYIQENMLEKMIKTIKEYNAQISVCSYYIVSENTKKIVQLPIKQKYINKNQFNDYMILPIIGRFQIGNYINFPGFIWLRLYDKSVLSRGDFVSEREYFTEDDIFNLIVLKKVQKIAFINEPLYYYWQGPSSLTQSYRKDCWNMLLKRYFFCCEYCLKNDIIQIAKDRLDFALFQAVSFSIDNICKLHDYFAFKKEIIQICSNDEVKSLFKQINKKLMSKSQLLLYYLIKIRMYLIIFLYRQIRIG